MRLENRVAIVTGGGQGIGRAVCLRFAKEGAAVAVADIAFDAARNVAAEIETAGGKALPIEVNVTDKESVKAMVNACLDKFGKLDILINNAGINRDTFIIRMTEEHWDQVMQVNLKGTFLCSQAVILYMKKNKWGRIVNTASIAALGNIGQANYSASKAGVIAFTKTLALEVAGYNINVNCVAPGATMTPMFESVQDKMKEFYLQKIPLKRFADPDEIAKVHLFLASEEASYITGQTIFVDGGLSIGN